MISIHTMIETEKERKAEIEIEEEKHSKTTEEIPSQQPRESETQQSLAKDDATVTDNLSQSAAQEFDRNDEMNLGPAFKLPVLPMIAAALQNPGQVHPSAAADMSEASEPPEDDEGSPAQGKRFDSMSDPDKNRERTLEQLFYKTAKFNPKSGRSQQTLVCRICSKTAWKKSNMRNHVRRHIDLKPFRCDTCGRGFAQSGNRDRHIKKAFCSGTNDGVEEEKQLD